MWRLPGTVDDSGPDVSAPISPRLPKDKGNSPKPPIDASSSIVGLATPSPQTVWLTWVD